MSNRGRRLGIAIAKTLIEAQRGMITVESAVGRGTVVTLALPQAALPELADTPKHNA